MSSILTALLCLGLVLSQKNWARIDVVKEKPLLSAHPGSMVPLRGNVTFLCDSQMNYDTFILSNKIGRSSYLDFTNQSFGKFQISSITRDHGGIYQCHGFHSVSPDDQSPPSNTLELLITGVYHKPNISIQEDAKKKSLKCFSASWYDYFLLSKEGDADPPQRLRSQYKAGMFQAIFPLSPASLAHRATYRCYSSLNRFSYLWSSPSEPLVLEHKGPVLWDHTTENIIRLGLAGVFLLVLCVLLIEAWLKRKDTQKLTMRPPF